MGIFDLTEFCIDGQKTIDLVKKQLDDALLNPKEGLVINPIALILLDFQMPLKNGIQVVQEIRKYYSQKQIETPNFSLESPVFVFLTAFKTQGFTNHLQTLNITHCYEKPISFQQLEIIVQKSFATQIINERKD